MEYWKCFWKVVLVLGVAPLLLMKSAAQPVPTPAATNTGPQFKLTPQGLVPIGAAPQAATNRTSAPVLAAGPGIPKPVVPKGPEPIAWDAINKEVTAKVGDTNAAITFSATNISSAPVTIRAIRPSCGCTVAKLPAQPWILQPGSNGQVQVSVDLRGKRGVLSKYLTVDSSAGYKTLMLKVTIPDNPAVAGSSGDKRGRNLMVALADRQAVFKGDCAQCHVVPTRGKFGQPLYAAACGVCHESPHRATMVPNLHTANHPANRIYWTKWITTGKIGTLMPAFAQAEGGPLSEAQINSLAEYLSTGFQTGNTALAGAAPMGEAAPAAGIPTAPTLPAVVLPPQPLPAGAPGLPPLPSVSADPPKPTS
jgi:cytochrome c553